jgi:hypothetical protein
MAPTIEQYTIANCEVGTTNIAVTVTLEATDLLLLFSTQGDFSARNVSVSGLGTWTRIHSGGDYHKSNVNILTGVTGTGDVVITVAGSRAEVTLVVVRGLTTPTVFAATYNTGSVSGSNVAMVGEPMTVGPDQLLLAVAHATYNGGAATLPAAASLPDADAWTMDNVTPGISSGFSNFGGHVTGGTGVDQYQLAITRTANWGYDGSALVLGEPAANAAMLTALSTEALTRSAADLALSSASAEVLTRSAADVVLSTQSVETLTRVGGTSQVHQLYAELLTQVSGVEPPVVGRRGWGILF